MEEREGLFRSDAELNQSQTPYFITSSKVKKVLSNKETTWIQFASKGDLLRFHGT